MSIFNKNDGLFGTGRRIVKGPKIISRKTEDNISELNMRFDDISQEKVNEFFSEYNIDDYSLNDGTYVFNLDSNDQDALQKFVREVGWLGKDGNYVAVRGIPGAQDCEMFADEAEGYHLSQHIGYDGKPIMVTQKPIEEIVEEVKEEVKEEPEVKGKFFTEDEINKMNKSNRGLKYAVGTLALFTALNITTNLYMDQEAEKRSVDRLNAVVEDIRFDTNTTRTLTRNQYKQTNLRIDDVQKELEEVIYDTSNGLVVKIENVKSDVDAQGKYLESKINDVERTITDSTTGVLARIDDVEEAGEKNYAALVVNQEEFSTKLGNDLEARTDSLTAQLDDVIEQKATSPWYLLKTGTKYTVDGIVNLYHKIDFWNKEKTTEIKAEEHNIKE